MAVKAIKVTFLHVDQGMGTLVGVYDNEDELTNLALFDLGCQSRGKKLAEIKGVNTVIAELDKMKTPTLDLVLISHQDKDHVNLLQDLKKKIKDGNDKLKTTTVKEIRYGGEDKTNKLWGTRARNQIREFAEAFKITAKPLPLDDSSYKDPPKKGAIAVIPKIPDKDKPMYVRLLCTGVGVSGKSNPDLRKNGASSVVAIEFAGVTVVLPGDAIADTLQWINWHIYFDWFLYALEHPDTPNPTEPCRALSVPHHGAIRTFGSSYVTTGKETEADLWVGREFSANVSANNIVASAGIVPRFKHPYKKVMEILGRYVVKPRPKHTLVWYDPAKPAPTPFQLPSNKKAKKMAPPPKKVEPGWDEVERTDGYYTTINKLGNPPGGYEPTFTIDNKGVITFAADIAQPEDTSSRERYPAKPRTAATPLRK